ncbi:MAG: tyrosine-type recombinase/integrase [Terriglobia bacterium]
MARTCHQKGYVRKKITRDPYWQGVYWEHLLLPDRSKITKRRSARLGLVKDLRKREAEKLLLEILADYNSRDYQPRVLVTLKEFVEKSSAKYLESCKEATKDMYWTEFRMQIFPEFGDRYLQDIGLDDLQDFINRKAKGPLSWNTVRILKVILSSVYQYAVKRRILKSNPVRDVALPPKPPKKRRVLPSGEQIEALLKELPLAVRTKVWLPCITGLRISELLALQWSSIDWGQKRICVANTSRDGKLDSPETPYSEGSILVTDEDLAHLDALRKERPSTGPDDFIFTNRAGTGPLYRRNILRRILRPAVKKVGIGYISWHLLRKWLGTHLVQKGIPVPATKARLRHSDVRTTLEFYVEETREMDDKTARTASSLIRMPAATTGSITEKARPQDVGSEAPVAAALP